MTTKIIDLGVDIQDDLGRHEVGFVDNTEKTPLNSGNGCRFHSTFQINKVPGGLLVAMATNLITMVTIKNKNSVTNRQLPHFDPLRC